MFQWAGIGFGQEENYRLCTSLKNLQLKTGANNLRFWGKILCRKHDLYVAEGFITKQFADEIEQETEKRGAEGVNKFSFWVTSDLLQGWVELPLIKPKHILQARQIKYLFTGDLEAVVDTQPEFEGQEKHLLKAQIIRITHCTVLAPADQYKKNDENEKLIELNDESLTEAGEFPAPGFDQIQLPETWVHLHPNILSTGRVANYRPPGVDEEAFAEQEEKLNAEEEKQGN